jgi:hypothetical protein
VLACIYDERSDRATRYPEATVLRDETGILIHFGGPHGQQKMCVPLQYVGEDAETVELRLLARLQQIGYRVRRGDPSPP